VKRSYDNKSLGKRRGMNVKRCSYFHLEMKMQTRHIFMRHCGILLLVIVYFPGFTYAQPLSGDDRESLLLFNEFKQAVQQYRSTADQDSEAINELSDKFLLYVQYDSANINFKPHAAKLIAAEVFNLSEFLNERKIENIQATPLRLVKDSHVFKKMTPFQKTNTLAVFDKRKPADIILYMLVIPADLAKSEKKRILSWKLVFAYNIYNFEDLIGNQGLESMFEGVQPPKRQLH
jgi:hypothetical protein